MTCGCSHAGLGQAGRDGNVMVSPPDLCFTTPIKSHYLGFVSMQLFASMGVYELFVGKQPNGIGRRGRFIVPTADVSAPMLVCLQIIHTPAWYYPYLHH